MKAQEGKVNNKETTDLTEEFTAPIPYLLVDYLDKLLQIQDNVLEIEGNQQSDILDNLVHIAEGFL